MQVELVIPGTEKDILPHPIKYGSLKKAMKDAGAESKRKYGCRHCGQNSMERYSLQALVSHLKDKYDLLLYFLKVGLLIRSARCPGTMFSMHEMKMHSRYREFSVWAVQNLSREPRKCC